MPLRLNQMKQGDEKAWRWPSKLVEIKSLETKIKNKTLKSVFKSVSGLGNCAIVDMSVTESLALRCHYDRNTGSDTRQWTVISWTFRVIINISFTLHFHTTTYTWQYTAQDNCTAGQPTVHNTGDDSVQQTPLSDSRHCVVRCCAHRVWVHISCSVNWSQNAIILITAGLHCQIHYR